MEETSLLDRLVSTAYEMLGDFDRFTAACMLYFAGAIRCEERYQRGETPTHLWNADDEDFVARSQQVNREGLAYLQDFFREHQVEFVPSVANFVMVHLPVDSGRFFEKMQRRGVLVRPLKGFSSANAVRVTVGNMAENRKFTDAFMEVMADFESGRE